MKKMLHPEINVVKNLTKKTVLGTRPIVLRSTLSQALGLMFRKSPECMIFLFQSPRIVRMHMMFVFFPIDIIALDGSGKVVALVERLLPWRLWNPGVRASAVVELPQGTISSTKTQVGDQIKLRFSL